MNFMKDREQKSVYLMDLIDSYKEATNKYSELDFEADGTYLIIEELKKKGYEYVDSHTLDSKIFDELILNGERLILALNRQGLWISFINGGLNLLSYSMMRDIDKQIESEELYSIKNEIARNYEFEKSKGLYL